MGEQTDQPSVAAPAGAADAPTAAEDPHAAATPGYTIKPRSTKSRANQTVRDLVLSMAVVGAFVAFLYLIVLRPTPDPVRVVDVAGPAAQAQIAGVFEVLVPSLPEGWRATSARFSAGPTQDTGQWFNGYINPQGQFVAVVQQDYELGDFVRDQVAGGSAEGTVDLGGQQWTMYAADGKADKALVREGGDSTVVVTGTVPYSELEQFAASLRPAATS